MKIAGGRAKNRKKRLGIKVLKMVGKIKVHPRIYKELEKGRIESNDRF